MIVQRISEIISKLPGIAPATCHVTNLANSKTVPELVLDYFYNSIPQGWIAIHNREIAEVLPLDEVRLTDVFGEYTRHNFNRFFEPYEINVYGGYLPAYKVIEVIKLMRDKGLTVGQMETMLQSFGNAFKESEGTFADYLTKKEILLEPGETKKDMLFRLAVGLYPMPQFAPYFITEVVRANDTHSYNEWGKYAGYYYQVWGSILEVPVTYENRFTDHYKNGIVRTNNPDAWYQEIQDMPCDYESEVRYQLLKLIWGKYTGLNKEFSSYNVITKADKINLVNNYYAKLNELKRAWEFIKGWGRCPAQSKITTEDALKDYKSAVDSAPSSQTVLGFDSERTKDRGAIIRQLGRLQHGVLPDISHDMLNEDSLSSNAIGWGYFYSTLLKAKRVADKKYKPIKTNVQKEIKQIIQPETTTLLTYTFPFIEDLHAEGYSIDHNRLQFFECLKNYVSHEDQEVFKSFILERKEPKKITFVGKAMAPVLQAFALASLEGLLISYRQDSVQTKKWIMACFVWLGEAGDERTPAESHINNIFTDAGKGVTKNCPIYIENKNNIKTIRKRTKGIL